MIRFSVTAAAAATAVLLTSTSASALIPDGLSFNVTYITYNVGTGKGFGPYTDCFAFGADGTTMTDTRYGLTFQFSDTNAAKQNWEVLQPTTVWALEGTVGGVSPKEALVGTGIDSAGNTYTLKGKQVAHC